VEPHAVLITFTPLVPGAERREAVEKRAALGDEPVEVRVAREATELALEERQLHAPDLVAVGELPRDDGKHGSIHP
jgi:hypothetical protein